MTKWTLKLLYKKLKNGKLHYLWKDKGRYYFCALVKRRQKVYKSIFFVQEGKLYHSQYKRIKEMKIGTSKNQKYYFRELVKWLEEQEKQR